MSRPTRGSQRSLPVRGCHPLWPDFPDGSGYTHATTGLVRVRSPLLAESRLMSFPPATEMFQFAGFASRTYVFSPGYRRSGGLPHSEIHGSKAARSSPRLIAACHVLHRLSVPRHPPDALHTLVLIALLEGYRPTYECATRRRKPTRNQRPARTHPAKMHRHDPTSSLLLRGDGPVGSSSVTHSLHMSKIPYPPSGRYLLSLSVGYLVPGH